MATSSADSRRQFLRQLGIGAVGLSAAPALLGQTGRLEQQQPKRPSGLKITAVKPYAFKKSLFVKVETDGGISGWGEADHEYSTVLTRVVTDICTPEVLGADPFDGEYLWNRMFLRGLEAGTSGLLPGAVAGIDNALWDLRGRALGLPVHKLMGGNAVEKVRVYGSYGRKKKGGYKTPDEMAKIGADFVAQGYRSLKVRFQLYNYNVNPEPDDNYAVVKAVRQAVGDDIEIFVDFNNGYTAAKATVLARKLHETLGVAQIEEPVSQQDYHSLRQVVEALDMPVAAGEHEYNKWQMRDLIVIGLVDVLNVDVIKCGGLTECRKVAGMAEAFEKQIMVHNTHPYLATAASLNLVNAIGNAARVQEFAGPRPDLEMEPLFAAPLRFEAGYLYVPTGPGLGLEVNEDAMERLKINK